MGKTLKAFMIERPVWIALVLLWLLAVPITWAEPLDTCHTTYRDLDGDGKPDLAIIACSPAKSEAKDLIYVYDRDDNMQATGDWRTSADFEDDVWLFDVGGDGRVNLVIDFRREGTALVADLFDDQDGDGQVTYSMEVTKLIKAESGFPTVRVFAPDGWWIQGKMINFNLDIEVDGPVNAAFGSEVYLSQLRTDGTVDFRIRIRDLDHDGNPDYQWIRPYPPLPWPSAVHRSQIIVRESGPDVPMGQGLFWPYLGSADLGMIRFHKLRSYRVFAPPIGVDLARSRVVHVGEFVASRGGDGNWFIYSLHPFQEGEVNRADFENPFAFYDLAADEDGIPELQIRAEDYTRNDPFFKGGKFDQPVTLIRYSWDQDNNQTWDYKLDLIGRNEIQGVVETPDFSVRTVSYQELPQWVTELPWDVASFVEVMREGYWTTEGVYENVISVPKVRDKYLTGLSDYAPVPKNLNIAMGFRGEYNLELHAQPYLYYSPIDHRLHLVKAQAGVWNIDGHRKVRYANLDGDEYNDRWDYFEDDALKKTLIMADSYLIYGGGDEVVLLEAAISPELFRTLPPRNHEDWLRLGEQLKRHERSLEPGDFKAMLSQFSGPLVRFIGARMEGFRLTPNGFRFVVELQPGFSIENPDLIHGTTAPTPGAYLLTGGNELSITRLTPPKVYFVSLSPQIAPDRPSELENVDVKVVLHNDGLQDVESLPIVFYSERPGQEVQEIGRTNVAVLGGEDREAVIRWVPRSPGGWRIRVEFDPTEAMPQMNGDVASVWTSVNISPAQRPGWTDLVAFGGQGVFGLLLPLLFGCLLTVAVVAIKLCITQ